MTAPDEAGPAEPTDTPIFDALVESWEQYYAPRPEGGNGVAPTVDPPVDGPPPTADPLIGTSEGE